MNLLQTILARMLPLPLRRLSRLFDESHFHILYSRHLTFIWGEEKDTVPFYFLSHLWQATRQNTYNVSHVCVCVCNI